MIKLLIGGSPCTYWSVARAATNSPITRETKNEGFGWELYLNYLTALNRFKPDIWLYENVASMSKDIKASITAHFNREPYQINGGLVSAAERDRFFWTNIEGVELPAERGIVLRDIMETNVPEKYFLPYPVVDVDMTRQVCAKAIFKNLEMHKRVFNPAFKVHTLIAQADGGKCKKILDDGRLRRLTPTEYERCATLPDGYTAGVSDGHRYKAIGNGWTADVIIHILGYALNGVPRDEEIVVLSLYDGIATGRYCLDKMGFKNVTYYAYEIDEKAMEIARKNWPDIIHMGDAFDVRRPEWHLPTWEEMLI
jgi:DNA (cytosine-5)-methyltransferase 3A